ncbi:MAG: hypothetical protein PHR13_12125 [Dysgonamonadaceae bacterium]|jgi:hypothetical protein|nr:hypothetical protein [Dysgonamonadaceae bacterium]MDD3901915.1 hypothetical protein [Dysgonamonadaceae bacterium]MDD4400247.1 hypothetical protein [Dysgonamonadaceae bacterium]
MRLTLSLFCTNIIESKLGYDKVQLLNQMLERFDSLNVSTIEFYDILRAIKSNVEAIDRYYRNSDSIIINISCMIPGPTHIIEFRSNLYRSLLIAKQYYT